MLYLFLLLSMTTGTLCYAQDIIDFGDLIPKPQIGQKWRIEDSDRKVFEYEVIEISPTHWTYRTAGTITRNALYRKIHFLQNSSG